MEVDTVQKESRVSGAVAGATPLDIFDFDNCKVDTSIFLEHRYFLKHYLQ